MDRKQMYLGTNNRIVSSFPKLTLIEILNSECSCPWIVKDSHFFFSNPYSKSPHHFFNMATKLSPLRAFNESTCINRCWIRGQAPTPVGEAEVKAVFFTNDHSH